MIIEEATFQKIVKISKSGKEGLVFLGTGDDLQEWITGIKKIWKDEGFITDNENPILEAYHSVSTGGRNDLTLVLESKFINKLIIWRIAFGDCSWISDFIVNYAKHYGCDSSENDYNESFDDDWEEDEDNYESSEDYEQEMGTEENEDKKPKCQLSGQDGNVFNIISLVSRALKNAEQYEKAKEFQTKAMSSHSYDEVLILTHQYVEVS